MNVQSTQENSRWKMLMVIVWVWCVIYDIFNVSLKKWLVFKFCMQKRCIKEKNWMKCFKQVVDILSSSKNHQRRWIEQYLSNINKGKHNLNLHLHIWMLRYHYSNDLYRSCHFPHELTCSKSNLHKFPIPSAPLLSSNLLWL